MQLIFKRIITMLLLVSFIISIGFDAGCSEYFGTQYVEFGSIKESQNADNSNTQSIFNSPQGGEKRFSYDDCIGRGRTIGQVIFAISGILVAPLLLPNVIDTRKTNIIVAFAIGGFIGYFIGGLYGENLAIKNCQQCCK